ncbi:MAG: L-seryl-tRNA(Sec) selenium transferase [Pseudomonadales bacterium]
MATPAFKSIPSIDRLLNSSTGKSLISIYGHDRVRDILREQVAQLRKAVETEATPRPTDLNAILASAQRKLEASSTASLKPVLNLTGTILHTNLGRAPLPEEAIAGIAAVASGASNLEFDLATGKRGDRDDHVADLLTEITGAEAVTLVNNNAAAVLLTLNTLAKDKEVPVSRGELVEIGGSFRIPEIMARAGCYLTEVGATNRTHLTDYKRMLGEHTGLVMKVHTSNYEIKGFTSVVPERDLADLTHAHGLPFVIDLGSGTIIDLTRFGLPFEPTVQQALGDGADLVTFSGDKLLGGPQVGIIAGRRDLIDQIKSNPMKRALRVDKMTLAALYEVVKLYRDPASLVTRLPALRLLTRASADIKHLAECLLEPMATSLSTIARVEVAATESQVGSGALPTSVLPGYSLAITPLDHTDASLQVIARAFRKLPVPVLGRIHAGQLFFDLRTLEDPTALLSQLDALEPR